MIDTIVIGAGASGLVTAIVAARRGRKVLILEKNNKVGKKLLATGNGKCNLSNQKPNINRFYSQNPSFVTESLDGYTYQTIKHFFKSIGLELIEAKKGKVFPMSLQASSVVELLLYECEQLGVEILCETEVSNISKENNHYKVKHTKGTATAPNLVISTGHLAAPQLGGVDDGVNFAKRLGHTYIKPFPSLVQLTSPHKASYLKQMAGVKVESRVSIETAKGTIEKQGDVLFTSYGISGLAILDISRFVMEELSKKKSIMLTIDLMPKMSHGQLLALMKKSLVKKSSKPLKVWMQGFINKKLIIPILEALKLQDETLGSIASNTQELEKIVEQIKAFKFTVNGSRGYKGAEVATGGVNTKEVNPKTMESKLNKGLYFTGEVLDVDGDRGGFNLHFTWVCGLRAGESL
jgi:hypothetical protein